MGKTDRELYAQVGLAQIPHILSLVDRNRVSPTYGCFDRSYWHYRASSFPSGMYQEFVLPLALIYQHRFPGSTHYCGQPRLRELVVAGIRYAFLSSHGDGSCDDYFPFERALGAVAFSLYACTESALVLDIRDRDLLAFFRKRGLWLKNHQESGQLSNHQALTVLALQNVYQITGEECFYEGIRKRLDLLLSWQTKEGWFPEYEGCDPGYLTATIDFLAKYHRKSGDQTVVEPLKAAIRFASHFIHPDGSYGGEYGSRNTFLFFPHGFELMGELCPEAAWAGSLYLRGLAEDQRVHLDDDRLCAHLTYNHLQAYLDYYSGPRDVSGPGPGTIYWEGARLYVRREQGQYAVVSTAKGGTLRVYRDKELLYLDSGLVAQLTDGTVLVSHLVDDYEVFILDDGIQVHGTFGKCRFKLPDPLTQALFHIGMLTIGRWGSDHVRALLQRLLILGKRSEPMTFKRTIRFGQRIRLDDEVHKPRDRYPRVCKLMAGTDHTSIYVAVSNSYQKSCLQPWYDYAEHLEALNRIGRTRIERIIG